MSYDCIEESGGGSSAWACVASDTGPYKTSTCDNQCGYDCQNGKCVPARGGPFLTPGCGNKCSMFGCSTKVPFGCVPWDERSMGAVEADPIVVPDNFKLKGTSYEPEKQSYATNTCNGECSTEPKYVCENGTCVMSATPGTGTSLSDCQAGCRKYACKISSNGKAGCFKSMGPYNPQSDGFDSKDACSAVCAAKWGCDPPTGKCLKTVKYGDILFDSAFETEEECAANGCVKGKAEYQCYENQCKAVTGYSDPNLGDVYTDERTCSSNGCGRYTCDYMSGTCMLDKKGIYPDKGQCDKDCNQRYTKKDAGCVLDPNGTMSLKECQDLLQGKGYSCDPIAGQCVQNPLSPVQLSKADCEKDTTCGKFYKCNKDKHRCELDNTVLTPEQKKESTAYACHLQCKETPIPDHFDAPDFFSVGSSFNSLGSGFPVGNGTFNLQTLRLVDASNPGSGDGQSCAGFQIFKDEVYAYNPDFRYQNFVKSSFQNKTTRSATLTDNTRSLISSITANASIDLSFNASSVSAEAQASVETKQECQMTTNVQCSSINIMNQSGEMRLDMTKCISLENMNPLFIERVMQLPVTSALLMSDREREQYEAFLFDYKIETKVGERNLQNPGSFFVTYVAIGTRYKQTTSRVSSDMSTLNELKASACASVSVFSVTVGACASYGSSSSSGSSNTSFSKTTKVWGGPSDLQTKILNTADASGNSTLDPIDLLEWMDCPMRENGVIQYKYMSVWDLLVNLAQQVRALERTPDGFSYARRKVAAPDDPELATEFATEECNITSGAGPYTTSTCGYASGQSRVYTFSQALLVRAKLLRDVFNDHADNVANGYDEHRMGRPLSQVKFPKYYKGHRRVLARGKQLN